MEPCPSNIVLDAFTRSRLYQGPHNWVRIQSGPVETGRLRAGLRFQDREIVVHECVYCSDIKVREIL